VMTGIGGGGGGGRGRGGGRGGPGALSGALHVEAEMTHAAPGDASGGRVCRVYDDI
jgi:hypothetical protein